MSELVLEVEGMWCGGCARALQRKLGKIKGVWAAKVHLESSSLQLEWDPAQVGLDKIKLCAEDLGYRLQSLDWSGRGGSHLPAELSSLQQKLAVSVFFAMWSMLFGAPLYLFDDLPPQSVQALGWAALALSAPVLFYGGSRFLVMAWRWLKVGVAGSDLLVSAGALGAWALTLVHLVRGQGEVYTDGTTMLVIFLLIGRILEMQARYQGEKSWKSLLARAPEWATRLDGERVKVSELRTGDLIHLAEGETVCVDGLVVNGSASLDSSLLTGESYPQSCQPGDLVWTGVTLLEGSFLLEVRATVGHRRLDRLAQGMRSALAQRGALSGLAERAAQWFSLVLAAAALICLASGYPERAITLAVVACPCALSLAVPLVVAITLSRAAAGGIHFRDGQSLERLAEVDTFLFDKTGTLTQGHPRLTGLVLHQPGLSEEQARQWAAEAVFGSSHPLSRALRQGLSVEQSGETTHFPGLGVCWRGENGQTRWLGSGDFLRGEGIPVEPAQQSGTRCYLAQDRSLLATFLFQDPTLAHTSPTLQGLHERGYRLGLLSGDHPSAVAEFIKEVPALWQLALGSLSPEEKAEYVGLFGSKVAVVGDGLNDTLALSTATVGVVVGNSAGVAFEAAGLVLRDVSQLDLALNWARSAQRKMKQSLLWAVLYNLALLPLAFTGQVGPGLAALAMGLSSVCVVLQALS